MFKVVLDTNILISAVVLMKSCLSRFFHPEKKRGIILSHFSQPVLFLDSGVCTLTVHKTKTYKIAVKRG